MTISPQTHHQDLHILFFPLMAQGHMIPTVDMARIFTARGATVTIVTTPLNAPLIRRALPPPPSAVSVLTVPFPAEQAGLPAGVENVDAISDPDQLSRFLLSFSFFEQALDGVLAELKPDALVADVFFTWAPELAARHGVPAIAFHGTSFLAMCCMHSIARYKPYDRASSDDEPFVLPGLPDRFELTRAQIPDPLRLGIENDLTRLLQRVSVAVGRFYGMLVNSFYELEPAYADHYRKVLGIKAWHIGPVSLCNKDNAEKARRGKEAAIDEHECLKWLESKKPDSVIYMCFGTNVKFSAPQLDEIAAGLEASGQDFIWVVSKRKDDDGEWALPEGFEERTRGRGLVIRGWAPQVLILDHGSVGGFVTHCGWNSVLEGVSAGLPMVTWPIFAEQFYNEKLITQVLGTGVGVGAKKWARLVGDFVRREQVERAVKEVMAGEGSAEMRRRARALGETARRAVEAGGSSYSELGSLIQELKSRKKESRD